MANITPVVFPLAFTKNDDWIRDIPVWADNEKTIPFVFTDWTGIMEVKKRSFGNPVIATFQTSDGSMVLTDGNIHLELLKANTDVNSDNYVYDTEFNDADDKNRTLFLNSEFLVRAEITDGSGL